MIRLDNCIILYTIVTGYSISGQPNTGNMKHLTTALQEAVRDAATTREVVIERDVASALPAVANRLLPGTRWLLVADEATWIAAGAATLWAVFSAGAVTVGAMALAALLGPGPAVSGKFCGRC